MLRLLLDTHALLWWLTDPDRMNRQTHEAISDPDNDVLISAVSGWEIALKSNLRKLEVPANVYSTIDHQGFDYLSVTFLHGVEAGSLPLHHRDPFDRLLVAQARLENLVLVTRDDRIIQYEVSVMAA